MLLLPWAVFQFATQGVSHTHPSLLTSSFLPLHPPCLSSPHTPTHTHPHTQITIPWSPTLLCLLTTSLVLVADYYTHSIASQRIDAHRVARASSLTAFTTAMLTAYLSWQWLPPVEHGLSAGVIIGSFLLTLATVLLTRSTQRHHESLVGYSASGLPLYSSHRSPPSVLEWAGSTLSKILASSDSRRIFYFLLINLVSSYQSVNYCNQVSKLLLPSQ